MPTKTIVIPYLSIAFSALFLIIPIRSLLNHITDEHKALEEVEKYEEKAIYFVTDYDKENPLT
jgi:hypothetical protein